MRVPECDLCTYRIHYYIYRFNLQQEIAVAATGLSYVLALFRAVKRNSYVDFA